MIGETFHRRLKHLERALGVGTTAPMFEKEIRGSLNDFWIVGPELEPCESSLLRLGDPEAVGGELYCFASDREPTLVTKQHGRNAFPVLLSLLRTGPGQTIPHLAIAVKVFRFVIDRLQPVINGLRPLAAGFAPQREDAKGRCFLGRSSFTLCKQAGDAALKPFSPTLILG